jgi:predicted GTPase
VFAGVDYGAILEEAEKEADVILWDGGNNDTPFYKPDVHICLVDPHRPGHELSYYPGETNVRMADVIIINKVATANPENIRQVRENVRSVNADAMILDAASPIFTDDPSVLKGKKVLVLEDGPTLTHGGMKYGAGTIAAERAGAGEFIDPRPFLVGELKETFETYPELGILLPAMGYGEQQVKDLEATIAKAVEGGVEAVAVGTPIDLGRIVNIPVPNTRVRYELQVIGQPTLEDALAPILKK